MQILFHMSEPQTLKKQQSGRLQRLALILHVLRFE